MDYSDYSDTSNFSLKDEAPDDSIEDELQFDRDRAVELRTNSSFSSDDDIPMSRRITALPSKRKRNRFSSEDDVVEKLKKVVDKKTKMKRPEFKNKIHATIPLIKKEKKKKNFVRIHQ